MASLNPLIALRTLNGAPGTDEGVESNTAAAAAAGNLAARPLPAPNAKVSVDPGLPSAHTALPWAVAADLEAAFRREAGTVLQPEAQLRRARAVESLCTVLTLDELEEWTRGALEPGAKARPPPPKAKRSRRAKVGPPPTPTDARLENAVRVRHLLPACSRGRGDLQTQQPCAVYELLRRDPSLPLHQVRPPCVWCTPEEVTMLLSRRTKSAARAAAEADGMYAPTKAELEARVCVLCHLQDQFQRLVERCLRALDAGEEPSCLRLRQRIGLAVTQPGEGGARAIHPDYVIHPSTNTPQLGCNGLSAPTLNVPLGLGVVSWDAERNTSYVSYAELTEAPTGERRPTTGTGVATIRRMLKAELREGGAPYSEASLRAMVDPLTAPATRRLMLQQKGYADVWQRPSVPSVILRHRHRLEMSEAASLLLLRCVTLSETLHVLYMLNLHMARELASSLLEYYLDSRDMRQMVAGMLPSDDLTGAEAKGMCVLAEDILASYHPVPHHFWGYPDAAFAAADRTPSAFHQHARALSLVVMNALRGRLHVAVVRNLDLTGWGPICYALLHYPSASLAARLEWRERGGGVRSAQNQLLDAAQRPHLLVALAQWYCQRYLGLRTTVPDVSVARRSLREATRHRTCSSRPNTHLFVSVTHPLAKAGTVHPRLWGLQLTRAPVPELETTPPLPPPVRVARLRAELARNPGFRRLDGPLSSLMPAVVALDGRVANAQRRAIRQLGVKPMVYACTECGSVTSNDCALTLKEASDLSSRVKPEDSLDRVLAEAEAEAEAEEEAEAVLGLDAAVDDGAPQAKRHKKKKKSSRSRNRRKHQRSKSVQHYITTEDWQDVDGDYLECRARVADDGTLCGGLVLSINPVGLQIITRETVLVVCTLCGRVCFLSEASALRDFPLACGNCARGYLEGHVFYGPNVLE